MEYKDGKFVEEPGLEPVFFDIETTGLNPMNERVVAVGVGWIDGSEPEVEVISTSSEYHMCEHVRDFSKELIGEIESDRNVVGFGGSEEKEAFIVTNYGRGFDHPFYTARCTGVYRQDPYPFGFRKKRLDISRVDGYHGKQDDMVERASIDVGLNDTVTGKDIPVLYEDGEMSVIRNHCRSDVLEIIALYQQDEETMLDEVVGHYYND